MNFIKKYFLRPFELSFTFKGRTSRKEYWIFIVFWNNIFLTFLYNRDTLGENFGFLFTISLIIYLLINISLLVRRMHDLDKSGFWILIPILSIFLALFPGDEKENKYGPPV
ncbi:MAG: DUF805 domain-containing protein [Bacteroidetes bacterium]|nr:DUF805 domain-containing protein [Bacteroidota bacterium]